MNRFLHILLLFFLLLMGQTLYAQSLKKYDLVSLMNGSGPFVTDSGSIVNLPLWGFGTLAQPWVIFPAPMIHAKEGDSVHVTLYNPSMEGHTIHLHGLDVNQANDGVPHTSQFVLTDDTFTYKFKAEHAGNYLYHCHVTTTMHLTLGMYGMVVIYPADSSNRIYTGGPQYNRQHHYLLSDMDARWNADYTAIGGFLTYKPDLYLIGGKNKENIYTDTNMLIMGAVGEQHLLRFMNVGYRATRIIFPDELNAVVHTSDGRVLDQSIQTDTLVVYPGERYSVLAEIMDDTPSYIAVDYLDPYRLRFLGREYIPVNDTAFAYFDPGINDAITDSIATGIALSKGEQAVVYPNPARDRIHIEGGEISIKSVQLTDLRGQVLLHRYYSGEHDLSVHLPKVGQGVFIIWIEFMDDTHQTSRIVLMD